MGNTPSLRKRTKEQKLPTAALPVAAAVDARAAEPKQQPLVKTALRREGNDAAVLDSDNQLENDGDGDDRDDNNDDSKDEDARVHGAESEAEEYDEEEDPLQFFRRLSSLSNGGSDGECESQDLFMSYTQALLLKERGDYAAASTLLRLVRNYKSLEIEAQHHLAQCLLMLDPELCCFGDEIVECLEKVCNAESSFSDVADESGLQQMQRESTELLAHVLVSQGYAERARALLRSLDASTHGNQYEEQDGIARFQTALCELALGSDLEVVHEQLVGADCRASLPLAHVDAQATERALADAIWRQRVRASSSLNASSQSAA